ncbi:MAG TPA: thioredoxin family protein [Candidatus Binatia bacterium]|nr:thioredoxin family protein [Candidatus Binatia bacterium]
MEKITWAELEQKIQTEPAILLDFSSPGCAPCHKISHALPALLAELHDIALPAYEVDVVAEPDIARKFFVLGVPTLIVLKNGTEVGRFNSLPKPAKIKQLLS